MDNRQKRMLEDDLVEAFKKSLLYDVAFFLVLIVSPLTRGEELNLLYIRIPLLIIGCAVSVWSSYQRIKKERKQRELQWQKEKEQKELQENNETTQTEE